MNGNLTLRGATVIGGGQDRPIENAVVTVIDGYITNVRRVSDVDGHREPTGDPATTLDLRGKYLIPGLVDAHQHLDQHAVEGTTKQRLAPPTEYLMIRSLRNCIQDLARGVTTVRDLGAKGGTNITVRDGVSRSEFVGPRILACGQMIGQTGGHGQDMTIEADGPNAVRVAVRRQRKNGADVIKLCLSGGVSEAKHTENPGCQEFTDAEICAGIDEAHRLGLRVAVHVHPAHTIKLAVREGADTVEHGAYLDEEGAGLLADHGATFIPTLDNAFTVAAQGARMGKPQWMVANARASLQTRMRAARLAIDAGVRMAVGTDVIGEVDREMGRLCEAGLSPLSALEAGTINGAAALGLTDVGRIASGMTADMVVLTKNPLDDLAHCQSTIDLVIKAGHVYDPKGLESALPGTYRCDSKGSGAADTAEPLVVHN